MENKNKDEKLPPCCRKKEKGVKQGVISALIPHAGCIAFIALSIFGATAAASIFRPLLLNSNFFYGLIALSFVFATISAALYLKKNNALSFSGIKNFKGYLSIMYGTTIGINLLMFFVIFPYAANAVDFNSNQITGSAVEGLSTLTLKVNIPCSGHAGLVIGDLKAVSGVINVKYRTPDLFDVTYDSSVVSTQEILSTPIFSNFNAKVVKQG